MVEREIKLFWERKRKRFQTSDDREKEERERERKSKHVITIDGMHSVVTIVSIKLN